MSRLANFSAALILSMGFIACDRDPNPKSEMVIRTGPAFMKPREAVTSLIVVFDELGNKSIEEYGVVYTFDNDVKDNYPDLMDSKVVFDLPAKQYSNEKPVNIEFPTEVHSIGYRAYAKLKGGELKYAEPVVIYF